ncbi:MAG: HAMP domain-containing histidine kinase [Blautia sp.]|nr:HAMP domain-containing histidine kinase [Blautia sp.]MCM1200263.1 HAMP domain-containing histidine kinase [Bacteroides fragilis]
MEGNISVEEREYASKIWEMRYAGELKKAVKACDEAIAAYGDNNFFYKIKGDILYTMKKYSQSMDVYMDYLGKIKRSPELFTNFSRFIEKICLVYELDKQVFRKLLRISNNIEYASVIRKGTLRIIYDYWKPSGKALELIEKVNRDFSVGVIDTALNDLNTEEKCDKIYFLYKININNCIKENNSANRHVLKLLEEFQLYDCALIWVNEILGYCEDGVIVRSLFRICRLRNDYSDAKKYMDTHDIAVNSDFNIKYELVLYYEAQGDIIERNEVLNDINVKYNNSIPISQTLFKFYIKYDMLTEAKETEKRINHLRETIKLNEKKQKIFEKQNRENQEILLERLTDLLEEQEHNRRLLAVTDLIKGFSHELGQPITNIRYAIQLFYMKQEKKQTAVNSEEKELLDGIIIQTGRVGKLLNRFAPIVSSKNQKEYFKVYDEIITIFEELSIRLNNENIKYSVAGNRDVSLYGEAIQFSQVFYNLIINAIYAINKKGIRGEINVVIQLEGEDLVIYFSDNGIGIPNEIQRKIFDPFYSTKRKESEEGGEGLGLYIVWNILKTFNGKISVDPYYADGARFVIKIRMEEKRNV